ncbi:MAG: ornithine cyclodeaminase family protein [Actinomycetales bacterium]
MRFIDADQVRALGPVAATRALVAALQSGLDPAASPPRIPVDLPAGHLLLMPAHDDVVAGVKLVTVAPDNPARGLPRIQAAYLLFDGSTLGLQAVIDGTALTTLRTPAVTMASILPFLPIHPVSCVIVGAGPQAIGHAEALAAHTPLASLTFLVREFREVLQARTATLPSGAGQLPITSGAATDALARAEVVVCATSAREPVFDSAVLRTDVIVAAVGSHEPDARELDSQLMARATIVVEDVDTALREAGDVTLAVAEGAVDPDRLIGLASLVREGVRPEHPGPIVVKTVGMAWEDLVVARACAELAS